MLKEFRYREQLYNVEMIQNGNSYLIRFFNGAVENYREPLSDLVVVYSPYGFLHLKGIGEDAVLSGFLNENYFTKDMVEDIIEFLVECLPEYRNCYLPYHIDFVSVSNYEEYNGEY